MHNEENKNNDEIMRRTIRPGQQKGDYDNDNDEPEMMGRGRRLRQYRMEISL